MTMMTRCQASAGILASAALAAAPTVAVSQEFKPFELPTPRSEGGQPLTQPTCHAARDVKAAL